MTVCTAYSSLGVFLPPQNPWYWELCYFSPPLKLSPYTTNQRAIRYTPFRSGFKKIFPDTH